jgi:FlaA1/EpsC-like NDP-sugar epimerase
MTVIPATLSEKLRQYFSKIKHMRLRKSWAPSLLLIGDLFLIVVAVLGSFALRLELGTRFVFFLPQALRMVVLAVLMKPVVFYFFGLYRRLWVYASIREMRLIVTAVTAASILLSLAVTLMLFYQIRQPGYLGFPRMVLVIDWLLTLFLVGGLRFSMRVLAESRTRVNGQHASGKRVLVVGAGDAGALVVRELLKNPQMKVVPVCLLDDDPSKHGQQIYGVPVVGKLNDLARTVAMRRIDEVIIAIPSAPGAVIRQVADVCRLKGVPFRTMPGIYELIGGKVSVQRLREVEITDLLRREPARINDELIGSQLSGRRVLITGAGGSIGRELCRQVARWGPSALILLGHGENSIYEIFYELREDFPSLPIYPVIADIRDLDRLNVIFEEHRPLVVFHTAAHKHVPLMEVNVEEAVTNNILGTRNVIEVSANYEVERLVMISTDKAIRPTSVYGATKRLAELIVLDAAQRTGRAFSVVRFGNVLGSRGSVIPIFKRQIERGGPVTITHPDMERYFMTIPEAVHLVLQAFTMGQGGDVFVLNMGEQIRILDLAEDLIRLSGLEPYRDIEIVFTGIRPGEKLSEELWDQWARYQQTSHPDVLLLEDEDIMTGNALRSTVSDLIYMAREGDSVTIARILDELIPGAAVRSTPPPDLTSIV